jgi:hypothetical protein
MIFRQLMRTFDFRKTIMRKGMIRKSGYRFSGKIMPNLKVQQQSGRWTGQGAQDYRKDGRHPKFKDHGRIAGR